MACDIAATCPPELTSNRKGVSGGTYSNQEDVPGGVAKAAKKATSKTRNTGRAKFWAEAPSRAKAPTTKVAAPKKANAQR